MSKELRGTVITYTGNINDYFIPVNDPYGVRYSEIRGKVKLLVKVINKLSFELGHPKDDLVYLIKEMINKGEL
jgi:hypothetical protein